MADPTLKDVLAALAKLDTKVEDMKTEMRAGFADVRKDIASLDADLDRHMTKHREIEKDVEALKKRTARPAARPSRAAPRRR